MSSPLTEEVTGGAGKPSAAGGVLVLDFDGVICDGFLECALVTWNAHFQRPVREFGPEGLAQIPVSFLNRFRNARGHARHLGHFLVPVLAGDADLRTQREFNACYEALPIGEVEAFVDAVTRYRNSARNRYRARWVGYHHLYDGLLNVLTSATGRWYVVTAKDRDSVLEILAANGVHLEASRVYGEQKDKSAALTDIARREQLPAADVHFFDDNLPNVMAARRDGYDARWAQWGFHTLEHAAEALRADVPSSTLVAFPATAVDLVSLPLPRQPANTPWPTDRIPT